MQTLAQIKENLHAEMAATDALILEQTSAGMPMAREITLHLLDAGGKRIRPLLVLLSARCMGWDGVSHEPIQLAAIIEYIHMATLLHDDVIDKSNQRRGKPTAHMMWGNSASVLVGDYLYSLAFQLMADLNTPGVIKRLATATHTIINGEIQQLMNRHQTDITETVYYQVIHAKTAELFSVAAELGALSMQRSAAELEAALAYGSELGLAYQLVDDALDYSQDYSDALGKDIGDDLAEGKLTLPLLYAKDHGKSEADRNCILSAIESGAVEKIEEICTIVRESGGLDHTLRRARSHAESAADALIALPKNAYRDALETLTRFIVERTY